MLVSHVLKPHHFSSPHSCLSKDPRVWFPSLLSNVKPSRTQICSRVNIRYRLAFFGLATILSTHRTLYKKRKKKFRLNLPITSFCLSLLNPPVRPGLGFSQILWWVFDVGFLNSFFLNHWLYLYLKS